MWLDPHVNANGVTVQLDPEWPRFRAAGLPDDRDESDWAYLLSALGTAAAPQRHDMAGVWAVRAAGTARDRPSFCCTCIDP